MDERNKNIVAFLKVLADVTRLEILNFLKNQEKSASDIQSEIKKSQSTISQQLKILINSDLLSVRREGEKKFYKIKNAQIFDILSIILSFISNQNREKIDNITNLNILDTLS
ncbi:MAG: ArsR/SmtB family transcription factor [Candidatus Helarchaeota archaeon]